MMCCESKFIKRVGKFWWILKNFIEISINTLKSIKPTVVLWIKLSLYSVESIISSEETIVSSAI